MIANIDAENAVIGGMLLDAAAVMPQAVMRLSPDDFSDPSLREIYRAGLSLYKDGRPVDPVTILQELDPGYRPLVLAAAESLPSISRCSRYITLVRDCARLRRAQEAADALSQQIGTGADVEEALLGAQMVLRALEDRGASEEITAQAGFLSFIEGRDTPREAIPTGFSRIDRTVRIERGDYIVVGGRPSSGKTALTLQIMLRMARTHKAAYFSLETSPDKLMDRLVACYCGLELGRIKAGRLSDAEWQQVAQAYDGFSKLQFSLVPAAGWTAAQIAAKTVQLGAQVIFVDYLGLVSAPGKTQYERTTEVSRALHTLAQRLGVTVVALSQMSRAGGDDPGMDSLRDSGQVEQDADAVLLLWRKDELTNDGDRELRICKNKEGRCGLIRMELDGARQTFREVETRK